MYSAVAQPLTVPEPDGSQLTSSPKLEKLYTEITSLTMIEVSEFTELLKVRLNLKDIPMGAMVSAPAAAGQVNTILKNLLSQNQNYNFNFFFFKDEEEEVATAVKTSFTVKLMKFDDKQKVALIKEVKNLMEGMNLVQVSTTYNSYVHIPNISYNISISG